MKYRQHKGMLADSMETVVELDATIEALVDHINDVYADVCPPVSAANTTVADYGYDGRINWNTHIVIGDGHVCGFTDGPVQTKEELCLNDDPTK